MGKWKQRGLVRAFVIFVAAAMILSVRARNTGAYLEDNAELDITIRYDLTQPGNDMTEEQVPTDMDAQADESALDNGENPASTLSPEDSSSEDQ